MNPCQRLSVSNHSFNDNLPDVDEVMPMSNPLFNHKPLLIPDVDEAQLALCQ